MYGVPGNRFDNVIRVDSVHALTDLVKEAQVEGKPNRKFFTSDQVLNVSYDGMFLVSSSTKEILDEGMLTSRLASDTLFAKVI